MQQSWHRDVGVNAGPAGHINIIQMKEDLFGRGVPGNPQSPVSPYRCAGFPTPINSQIKLYLYVFILLHRLEKFLSLDHWHRDNMLPVLTPASTKLCCGLIHVVVCFKLKYLKMTLILQTLFIASSTLAPQLLQKSGFVFFLRGSTLFNPSPLAFLEWT